MTEQFALVDRTEDYTPAFRTSNGFLELWSVDLSGKTIGLVRKHAESIWSARAYDGKHRNGWAKHRLLGDADAKDKAVDLILSFHAQVTSDDGQMSHAREIIAGLLNWLDPAYKPGPDESLENILHEARAFMWPDMWGHTNDEMMGEPIALTASP